MPNRAWLLGGCGCSGRTLDENDDLVDQTGRHDDKCSYMMMDGAKFY